MNDDPHHIFDNEAHRGRTGVFDDRAHAGRALADMLADLVEPDELILAVPAGGVPVGATIAETLDLDMDLAVVSKITLPWNTEAGYGAVAWDGTCRLNDEMLSTGGLDEQTVAEGRAATREKVRRRVEQLRGNRPLPDVADRAITLVDDGLASGFTMRVAVEALANQGAERIRVAVPTAHRRAAEMIARHVESVHVANLRSGGRFAVAEAYRHWRDVGEAEMRDVLDRCPKFPPAR